MIIGSERLCELLPEVFGHTDLDLVNPASVDIRLGLTAQLEDQTSPSKLYAEATLNTPFWLEPGAFILISTLETVTVPNDMAIDLRLKSSRAREGYDHSLAFWVDPGWSGILTMEVKNVCQYRHLPLYPGLRFAQCILHEVVDGDMAYSGRYQGATGVEQAKEGN